MKKSKEHTAVVFIDIINDFNFEDGEKLLSNTKEILPNLKKLKQYALKNKFSVIYVNDHYGVWQTSFQKISALCKNHHNEDIINEMLPEEEDYFLIKPKHSGFFQTALASLLRELNATHVIFAGIAGNICVLFTANDAHMREFSIHVPKNCIASNEVHENEQALNLMKIVLSADINPI